MAIKVNGTKKISNLTAASTINDADVFMVETTSGSRKVTGAVLKTLINNLANTAASGVSDILAGEFDASNSYSAGDYVLNDGKLYKFTADHTTGAFDGSDAVEVTIVDEMVNDVTINGSSIVQNGVASIPIAGANSLGVVNVRNPDADGIYIGATGYLQTYTATSLNIKSANNTHRPIASSQQDEFTFYGLAKAAGDTTQSASANAVGTYTDEAKAAIKSMLGVNDGIEVVRLV